jgi:hypothetical protein
MRRLPLILGVLVVLATSITCSAAVVQIQGGPTAPEGWNAIESVSADLTDLLDPTGASTGWTLVTDDANTFQGLNQSGTATPDGDAAALFPSTVTADNWFGNTEPFSSGVFPTAIWTFGNLDTEASYSFTFFGSRMSVSDNRETQYALQGLNADTGFLDVANNTGNIEVVSGIMPDPAGQIMLTVTPGPNNTNGSGFFYLGGLIVESHAVPEPSSFVLVVGAIGMLLFRRRR